MSSEGITTLQKYLYFHILSYEIHVYFLLQKNEANCLDVIPLNNAGTFPTARQCHPSAFGIDKRIIFFLRIVLYLVT